MEAENPKQKIEEKIFVPTEKGLINQALVDQHKEVHLASIKENSGLLADPDQLQP